MVIFHDSGLLENEGFSVLISQELLSFALEKFIRSHLGSHAFSLRRSVLWYFVPFDTVLVALLVSSFLCQPLL